MKLYILTFEDVYEGDSNHMNPIVKTSLKEARKELNRLYRSAKETYEDTYDTCEKSRDSFSLYEDGYYCQNHYNVVINVVDVPNIRRKINKK